MPHRADDAERRQLRHVLPADASLRDAWPSTSSSSSAATLAGAASRRRPRACAPRRRRSRAKGRRSATYGRFPPRGRDLLSPLRGRVRGGRGRRGPPRVAPVRAGRRGGECAVTGPSAWRMDAAELPVDASSYGARDCFRAIRHAELRIKVVGRQGRPRACGTRGAAGSSGAEGRDRTSGGHG
jgi:hypothetical protein